MLIDGQTQLVDMNKANKKWSHIVEKMGITDAKKKERIVEYAELHSQSLKKNKINENAMYGNASNTAGMGAVNFPGLSGTPGLPGGAGSGDLGEVMLPASLKIAAHTPGLDLLPVVNVNSNRVDLLYFDWKYDDSNNGTDPGANDELMSTFKVKLADQVAQDAFVAALRADMVTFGITELRGRISSPIYYNIDGSTAPVLVEPTGAKTNVVQFKGFSRIDGMPMFRAWTQSNTASSGGWTFDATLNTFGAGLSITAQLAASNGMLVNGAVVAFSTGNPAVDPTVLAVSLNEDFIDDFTTNRQKTAMTRGDWDVTEAGKIGPDSFVASVEIGVAHVQASLRLSEIGDWKRMYGVDVVQKTIEQLTVQISQKISTEIVDKVQELGLRNRTQAPAHPTTSTAFVAAGITDARIYDFSTTLIAGQLGGENTMSIARKLWSKVQQASYFIATDGRIGGADYIIASGTVMGVLKSVENYAFNPMDAKLALPGQLSPAGEIDGIKLYVDPYKNPADLSITLGRVNNPNQAGLKFFSYMLAETVEVVDNRLFAPTIYMYSRYAITEFGFFPEKQYYTIKVEDTDGLLY